MLDIGSGVGAEIDFRTVQPAAVEYRTAAVPGTVVVQTTGKQVYIAPFIEQRTAKTAAKGFVATPYGIERIQRAGIEHCTTIAR